ncbi:MAG: tetratricopeptide repeat protein [Hyphomicrobiaceae bacterium]|nr:tetratricopeptide repeat protein [Hyphomicrobiaceae bacterium]
MLVDTYKGRHTTTSPGSVAAFGEAVFAVAAHRPAGEQLGTALRLDPELVSAHALKGFGSVLLGKQENFATGRTALREARRCLASRPSPTASETALVGALALAVDGHFQSSASLLEAHAASSPGELLPLKLANAMRFMSGEPRRMRETTGAALDHMRGGDPGYGFVLGMHAFALEETGGFEESERIGRMAVLAEPADVWGVHAVSHVLEMRGRAEEGTRWLQASRNGWPHCNNFSYHLAWHLALFHLEAAHYDRVLDLYDRDIRPTDSDDFRDMANAVSLLWRLEQEGIAVGDRWTALYAIAHRRRVDTSYVFASLHYLLALIARRDLAAASELVSGLRQRANDSDDQSAVARSVGVPFAETILAVAHSTTGDTSVLDNLGRLARDLQAMGGSHAQRDVFMRTLMRIAADRNDALALAAISRARGELKCADRFAAMIDERVARERLACSA